MTENFWNNLQVKIIISAYLFNGNINNFLEYDYVGKLAYQSR